MDAQCSNSSLARCGGRNGVPFKRSKQYEQACAAAAAFVLVFSQLAVADVATKPTADNPNSVLQIDFSRQLDEVDIPECARHRTVNATLADQEVACLLPRRESSGIQMLDMLERFLLETPDADAETTSLLAQADEAPADDCKMPTRLSRELYVGSPELQSYMRAARLRWLLDRCFRFSDVGVREWRYELCIGRKVTLFKGNALTGKTVGKSLFELGTYSSSMDQLWADGTMTQWYTGGTEGRQTEVMFVCGDTLPRVKGISGPHEGKYRVWLEAPVFCDFRENATQPALTESLLRSLEGWCSTFSTDGWWSYEYCHPDSLIQYHKESNGEVTGPLYLLGTLHTSGDAAEIIFKRPNPANPTLRGADTLPPRANGKPRFKFLPVQLVDRPVQFAKNPTPAPNKVLALQLTSGTVCEGTDKQRSARVLFECPVDFPILATHRIVHIEETSFCSYDLLVHTPLVCAHPKLLPPRPLDPQEILAYPTGQKFTHDLIPASWKGLAGTPPPSQTNGLKPLATQTGDPTLKQHVSAQLEAVPKETLDAFQDGHSVDGFGFSSYIRRRTSIKEPRFKIGEIVRHRWWGYTAVVLSWDATCMASDAWSKKVYSHYPVDLYSKPHYLLLVDTAHESANGWPLYAYVPEASLEKVSEPVEEIAHPTLYEHFKHYLKEGRRYVVDDRSVFAEYFQEDDFS